ncbi:MAG: hypothetical protein OXN91_00465 [Chloroflexota bacterium]|nr:hypothetical protein [Chloroflexota bacterium]
MSLTTPTIRCLRPSAPARPVERRPAPRSAADVFSRQAAPFGFIVLRMWIRVAAAEIVADDGTPLQQFYGSGPVKLPPHVARADVAAALQAALERLKAADGPR